MKRAKDKNGERDRERETIRESERSGGDAAKTAVGVRDEDYKAEII